MIIEFLLKMVAIFFLILFIVRLVNPKVFPYLRKGLSKFLDFLIYTFRLFVYSSFYTVNLVFKKTVLVIGLDILLAFILNVVITTISYPNIQNFSLWFALFKDNLFNVYVFSFFIFTYIIGLFHYLKTTKNISMNFFTYVENQFNSIFTKNKGAYTYDEKKNKYTYRD